MGEVENCSNLVLNKYRTIEKAGIVRENESIGDILATPHTRLEFEFGSQVLFCAEFGIIVLFLVKDRWHFGFHLEVVYILVYIKGTLKGIYSKVCILKKIYMHSFCYFFASYSLLLLELFAE